jgi:DNA-binding NarL/FixJ family response regulator
MRRIAFGLTAGAQSRLRRPAVSLGDAAHRVRPGGRRAVRQPWTPAEIQKLHLLAGKGQSVRAIAKALTRSEDSVKERAKQDGLKITKLH